jgi:hypothetical protein
LTSRFVDFAGCRDEWLAIGRRNQEAVRPFVSDVLYPKRIEFYQAIRDSSQDSVRMPSELNHAA